MSTLLKRTSSETITAIAAAELKRTKSCETKSEAKKSALDVCSDIVVAWGAGRFNEGDVDAALAEFYAEDVVMDASSGAYAGVAVFKEHHGFAGMKEWFAWAAGFKLEGIDISQAVGPDDNEVWMHVSFAMATWLATGKSAPFSAFYKTTVVDGKVSNVVASFYNPSITAAIMSTEDVEIPPTTQYPAFEPHENPMEPFGKIMALWGAGDLLKEEVRREHFVPECVDDLSDGVMPDKFKPYKGIEGTGEWLKHAADYWEMGNVEYGAPVVGLKPGCIMHSIKFDLKHTVTGKKAEGVQMYNEYAYNAEGKFVYGRHYCLNAQKMASVY